MERLFDENPQLECWVFDNAVFDRIPAKFHGRLNLLDTLNKEMLIKAWKTYSWDAVLHLVSKYEENVVGYKKEIQNQRSLIGGVISKIFSSIGQKPFYVEIETDWMFDDEIDELIEDAKEVNVLFLENYANRIGVETTNILSKKMQPSHWIFSFMKSLENKTRFGVPCNAKVLRDWIALEDYIEAICVILSKGDVGNQYAVVGFNEWTNYDLMLLIGATYDRLEIRENGVFKFKLCNEEIVCRKSYRQTKIGLNFMSLHETFKPKSVYDIVDELIGVPFSLVTKG